MTTTDSSTLTERLHDLVARRVTGLQSAYRNDESRAVAELALLRRGVGQPPGHDARLIGLTVVGLYPETRGLPDEPTSAEYAAFAALTLFALHQQSHRTSSMHRKNFSFGRSARLLGRHTGAQHAVRARFTAAATATSWDETLHHARGLIQQFRAYDVPLDYGRFAVDLYRLRDPRTADNVRLAWGRDFYRVRHPEDDAGDASEPEEATSGSEAPTSADHSDNDD